MRVDLRRVRVGVAEVFLDGPQRLAVGRKPGGERVPQVVERDHAYPQPRRRLPESAS